MIDPESGVLIGRFYPRNLKFRVPKVLRLYEEIVVNYLIERLWFWVDKLICENEMDLWSLIKGEKISIYKSVQKK